MMLFIHTKEALGSFKHDPLKNESALREDTFNQVILTSNQYTQIGLQCL